MNKDDVMAVLDRILDLWPNTEWDSATQDAVFTKLKALSIPRQSAFDVLARVRVSSQWPSVQPGEFMPAMIAESQAAASRSQDPFDSPTVTEEDKQLFADAKTLARDPITLSALVEQWRRPQRNWKLDHWSPSWFVMPDDVNRWVWGVKFVRWVRSHQHETLEALRSAETAPVVGVPRGRTGGSLAVIAIANGNSPNHSERAKAACRAEVERAKAANEQPNPHRVVAALTKGTA